jgi:hypothetical protein
VRARPAILAIVAAAGCGGSSAAHHPPAVPLSTGSTTEATVVGGTASMRARARSILTGMGPTAIAQVRIGPPPARFGLNAATNSMWLTVTLHRPPALARAQWTQLAGGSTLWQASVFENAFTRSAPRGEPRVRGSTEAVQGPPMTGTGSGTFDRPRFTGPVSHRCGGARRNR